MSDSLYDNVSISKDNDGWLFEYKCKTCGHIKTVRVDNAGSFTNAVASTITLLTGKKTDFSVDDTCHLERISVYR